MTRFFLRRLAASVPLLLVVSAATFLLVALVPGDAARSIAGRNATPEQVAQVRTELGLDRPVWTQYIDWLGSALHGDLGTSLVNQQAVTEQLNTRLGATMSLIIGVTMLAGVLGVALGVLAARGGWLGKIVDAASLIGFAVPTFWLALVLVVLLAVKVPAFPALGYTPLGQSPAQWMSSLFLPVITLAIPAAASVAKVTRDAVSDALQRPFVRTLRAAGVSERAIFGRHALKNAAVPILTIVGLTFIGALTGAVLIEQIFALPGLGGTAVTATAAGDLPLIQGVVIYFTVIVIAVNLLVDLAYAYFNPRMRVS